MLILIELTLSKCMKFFVGDAWFDKFGELDPGETMVWPSHEEVLNFQKTVFELTDWESQSRNFILQKNFNDKLADESQMYFMEHAHFKVNDSQSVNMVVSCFSASGDNFKIVHIK